MRRGGRLGIDVHLRAALGEEDVAARHLAGIGVDGVFSYEGPHDVFFPLVVAARSGADVDLLTNVAIAPPRSPLHLAHAAWDLQALCRGRFRLGLGSQVRAHIEHRYGAQWSQPVQRMRETVEAIKAMFAAWEGRGPLDYRGRFTRHTLMTPTFDPGPHPYGVPPVLVGALGPRMTEMAAACADGLLVMPFTSRRHLVERTLPAVERGLASAGRPAVAAPDRDFEVVDQVIVCCGRSEEEMSRAETGTRLRLAFYGSTPAYRPVLEVEGWSDLQPELNTLSKQGRWTEMATLIDDTMLRTLAVRGTPAQCAEQIIDRVKGFGDRIALTMSYELPAGLLAELVEAIRAADGAG